MYKFVINVTVHDWQVIVIRINIKPHLVNMHHTIQMQMDALILIKMIDSVCIKNEHASTLLIQSILCCYLLLIWLCFISLKLNYIFIYTQYDASWYLYRCCKAFKLFMGFSFWTIGHWSDRTFVIIVLFHYNLDPFTCNCRKWIHIYTYAWQRP